jgi:hypothetical protein
MIPAPGPDTGGARPAATAAKQLWASLLAGPLQAPFVVVYLLVSWVIFLSLAQPGSWFYETDGEALRPWLYAIPDLAQDVPATLSAVATAPWVHITGVQMVFVTLGLLVFGARLEFREGTLKTVAIFFATTAIGACAAGLLLHVIYPGFASSEAFETAWERTWGGGSAGAFGVVGALVGRARSPLPLIGAVLAWEASFALLLFRDFVPAFHIPAFFAGFAATRYLLPGPRDESVYTILTGARPS